MIGSEDHQLSRWQQGILFGGVSSEVGFEDGQSRWDVGWRWRQGRSEDSPGSSKESGGARLWHNRSCK